MIRFKCTICDKVKRVRQLPPTVRAHHHADGSVSGYTDGTCRYHSGKIRRGNRPTGKHIGRTRRVGATAAKSKSKK